MTPQNYKDTCGRPTWDAMMHYANKLLQKKIKIAFFSATPQGGGVALMRHALVRFSRLMGVDLTWYGKSSSAERLTPCRTNNALLMWRHAPRCCWM